MIAVFKISNNGPNEFSLTIFFGALKERFCGQKAPPLNARPKRSSHMPATTVQKEEIQKKERSYCMSGAPNDVSFKDTTRIPVYRGFLYTPFQRMQPYGQDGCVSIVNIEEILLFNVVGLMLRTGFQEGCYGHIPPFKSGEDNQ